MAVSKNQKALLRKLKKQIRLSQRREEQGRTKLKNALKKLNKMGRSFKSKLARKMRQMQGKVKEAQSSIYAKVAADIERQMMKNITSKSKSLSSAITKLEKKNISKLTKGLSKKGKKRKAGGKKKKDKSSKARPAAKKRRMVVRSRRRARRRGRRRAGRRRR